MATRTKPNQDTQYSEQNVLNNSYDKDYHVLAVEQLGYDYSTNSLIRIQADTTGLMIQPIKFYTDEGIKYFKFNGDAPQICSQDYLYAVAEGDIADHDGWTKLGYNGDLGAAEEDLWAVGGSYVAPTAEMAMEVVSSSASDVVGSGTGLRTVSVYYLDDTFTPKTEDVALNGTTPVVMTASDIYRINAFRATSAGVNGKAAGNIDVRHIDNTPVYSRIPAGYTQARNSHYTVPKDKTLYITSVTFSAGSAVAGRSVRMTTKATWDSAAGVKRDFFYPFTEVIVQDGAFHKSLEIPTKFTEGVDLKVSAISPDGATYGSCSIKGWLEGETEESGTIDTGQPMGLLTALTYQI
jgi:hypothetical protein